MPKTIYAKKRVLQVTEISQCTGVRYKEGSNVSVKKEFPKLSLNAADRDPTPQPQTIVWATQKKKLCGLK